MASSRQHPGRDNVLEMQAVRALAHPLRIRILDELSMFGPLTASGLGERLSESSGSMSYHLRQLEKHRIVREVEGKGSARERWWERVPGSISVPEPRDFPAGSAERLATQLNATIIPAQPALPAILNEKIERAAAYARSARSAATRRAYESDWAIFTAWCAAHGLAALPASPDVVAVFASEKLT